MDAQPLLDTALDDLLRLSPELATRVGDHRSDDRLDDLTPSGLRERARVLAGHRDELDSLDLDALDPDTAVDVEVLRQALDLRLFTHEVVQPHTWDPLVAPARGGPAPAARPRRRPRRRPAAGARRPARRGPRPAAVGPDHAAGGVVGARRDGRAAGPRDGAPRPRRGVGAARAGAVADGGGRPGTGGGRHGARGVRELVGGTAGRSRPAARRRGVRGEAAPGARRGAVQPAGGARRSREPGARHRGARAGRPRLGRRRPDPRCAALQRAARGAGRRDASSSWPAARWPRRPTSCGAPGSRPCRTTRARCR